MKTKQKKIVERTREQAYDLWIEALKSGKYKQGEGQLKYSVNKKPQYCCLGVLCDLAEKDGGAKWVRKPGLTPKAIIDYEYNGSIDLLPNNLADFMGLTMEQQKMLARWNDELRYNFNQIASNIKSLKRQNCNGDER